MELILERNYLPRGTNGKLYLKGQNIPFCYTIELPWQQNAPQHSCIPEGTYTVVLRSSEKFKTHLHILDVPGREWILIHPANDALTELRGCIAPVSVHTGEGSGTLSRRAFEKLMNKVMGAFNKPEPLLLTITKADALREQNKINENDPKKSQG